MPLPVCVLCHVETLTVDRWGLCARISITHDAVRRPDLYPAERFPDLWEVITSGSPVFPLSAAERAAYEARQAG